MTLAGTVDSREAKRRAEDSAERVSGVKHGTRTIFPVQPRGAAGATGTQQGQHQVQPNRRTRPHPPGLARRRKGADRIRLPVGDRLRASDPRIPLGIHPMLLFLKRRIVRCGKPGPLVRTMRSSDPKVESARDPSRCSLSEAAPHSVEDQESHFHPTMRWVLLDRERSKPARPSAPSQLSAAQGFRSSTTIDETGALQTKSACNIPILSYRARMTGRR